MLLIDRELAELEDDAECASFLKLTKLVKKSSNLTKTGEKKPHCPISHFLACFIKLVGRLCFYLVESLTGLADGLALGGTKSRGGKVAISFFG